MGLRMGKWMGKVGGGGAKAVSVGCRLYPWVFFIGGDGRRG